MLPKDLLIPTLFLLRRRPVKSHLWDMIEEVLGPVHGIAPSTPAQGAAPRSHRRPGFRKTFFPLDPQWHETNEIQGGRRRQWIPHQERPSEIKKPPSARDRWGRRGDTHVETLSTTRSRGNRASRHKWRDWHQGRSQMKCQSCQQCHLCIRKEKRVGATGSPQPFCSVLVSTSRGHPLSSIG